MEHKFITESLRVKQETPMTAPCRSAKEIRKMQKLVKKGLYLLNKDNSIFEENMLQNVQFHLSEASKIIFIVNGGLTTGVDNVTIMELFIESGFNRIEEVIMIPGKQYSFAILTDPGEAKKAVEAMSGIKCLPLSKNPLYMACIDKVPFIRNPVKYKKPPGLILIEDFISKEEEMMLSNLINWEESSLQPSEGSELKYRQVRHFGYEFQYSSNSANKSPLKQKIPCEVISICQRMVERKLMSELPDQLTINRYLPGQGIPPHVDTHSSFMGEIALLSILGSVTMGFRSDALEQNSPNIDGKKSPKNLHYSVYLPGKSLCLMTGPVRFSWTHGICPRKTDIVPSAEEPKKLLLKRRTERMSFTFRKVREGECKCSYPLQCDSQHYGKNEDSSKTRLPIQAKSPSELEREHVLNVYEKIAEHFSYTRHKPWPKVLEFVQSLPGGTLMLDVGCGNGKYLGSNKHIFQLGSDTSVKLLDICNEKKFEVSLSNCLNLPFREGSFDAVICIAVIHHLASEERRRKAVSEIVKVLRHGGIGLVYVWALEQRKGKMSAYLKQKRSNRKPEHREFSFESEENEYSVDQESPNNEFVENKVSHNANLGSDINSPYHDKNEQRTSEMLLVHENRTDFVEQDMFVPWKIKPEKYQPHCTELKQKALSNESLPVYHRYYHVFKEGELDALLLSFPSVRILNSYYDEGNWCVLFKKLNFNE